MIIEVPKELAEHLKLALHLTPYVVCGRAALGIGAGISRIVLRLLAQRLRG